MGIPFSDYSKMVGPRSDQAFEDTFSIYSRSAEHPNAFVVNCHSGVTLAAVHAKHLAAWIAGDDVTPGVGPFSLDRFDVQTAA